MIWLLVLVAVAALAPAQQCDQMAGFFVSTGFGGSGAFIGGLNGSGALTIGLGSGCFGANF